MTDALVSGLLSSTGLLYGVVVPLILMQLLALMFIPSLLHGRPNPRAVAAAVSCYFLQGVGILLMTVGALPTVFSVLAGVSYTGGTYIGLLLTFATGGALFLWQDQKAQSLDPAARAVPETIFLSVLQIIGSVTLVLSLLSFILNIALGTTTSTGWWVMPLLLAAYGGVVAWCTRETVAQPRPWTPAAQASPPVARASLRRASISKKKR